MAEITFNFAQFQKLVKSSFDEIAKRAASEMNSTLTEENREFPRTTIRQFGRGITGQVAESPRDVVDSGTLVRSQKNKPLSKKDYLEYSVTWAVPYAALIYTGYGDVPPFPWVRIALHRLDYKALFIRQLQQYFKE